ncbi:MAG: hypothetical protein WCH31_08545 [Actinomycetes bacterium]
MPSPRPSQTAKANKQAASCQDCYFHRRSLCALSLEQPCSTFRAAGVMLQPPRQAPLTPRPIAAVAVA